jgi:hypothetical protein
MISTCHLADLGVDFQNVEVLVEFANGLMPFLLLKAQFRVLSGIGLENVPREGKGMIGLLGERALVERHAYKG